MTGPSMIVPPELGRRQKIVPPTIPVGTRTGPGIPRQGQVVWLGREASVQFADGIHFLVIRALGYATYDGWTWLQGYELDSIGEAIERRNVYVQIRGIRPVNNSKDRPARRKP